MFAAVAAVTGYGIVSMYHRHRQSQNIISEVDTTGYKHVSVVYVTNWLCPNLRVVVVGLKDDYISKSDRAKALEEILLDSSGYVGDRIDAIKKMKLDSEADKIVLDRAFKRPNDSPDGEIIAEKRVWVFPALLPGGISRYSYSRASVDDQTFKLHAATRSFGQ
jgi:hypothetical protein